MCTTTTKSLLLLRCALGMTAPSDLEDPPVTDLPELPAEIWARIWQLVAAQSGFVGAWRLIGGAICKAATEGWGFKFVCLQVLFLFSPPYTIRFLQSSDTFES